MWCLPKVRVETTLDCKDQPCVWPIVLIQKFVPPWIWNLARLGMGEHGFIPRIENSTLFAASLSSISAFLFSSASLPHSKFLFLSASLCISLFIWFSLSLSRYLFLHLSIWISFSFPLGEREARNFVELKYCFSQNDDESWTTWNIEIILTRTDITRVKGEIELTEMKFIFEKRVILTVSSCLIDNIHHSPFSSSPFWSLINISHYAIFFIIFISKFRFLDLYPGLGSIYEGIDLFFNFRIMILWLYLAVYFSLVRI